MIWIEALKKFYEKRASKRINFRKKWQIKENEIAIGIIGRLVPIKNHSFFIDVVKKAIANSNKKLRIFIVGDGENKKNIIQKLLVLKMTKVVYLELIFFLKTIRYGKLIILRQKLQTKTVPLQSQKKYFY